jgi:hypothetical protein
MATYKSDGTRGQGHPQRNFLDLGGDLKSIINKILKNDNLVKLIYYNTPSIENQQNLTNEQKVSLINTQIKMVPKIDKDLDFKNYVIVQFDKFVSFDEGTEFKQFLLNFDIICHSDFWIMDDYMLRPFKIMNEIDSMFNKSKLNSFGPVTFLSAEQLILNENLMGYSLFYRVHEFQ